MSDTARDAAQELAERVAERYWGMHIVPSDPGYRSLIALITNELRADGWVKSAAPHVASEDLMSGIR